MNGNKSSDNLLTLEEARDHVKNRLKIEDFEEKVKRDRVAALTELIKATYKMYAFQDIDLMATEPRLRRVPTYSDIKDVHFSGKGGLCITNNTFCMHLIRHFGYKSYMSGATVIGNHDDSHSVVIVQDLVEPGDLHLVDVGCGYPTYEPVSLTGKPKIFKHSFLEYTIVKINDEKYGRYHLKGDDRELLTCNGMVIPPEEKIFYTFTLKPRSHEFFQESMYDTFTDEAESIFLRYVFVAYYPPDKGYTIKENHFKIYDNETGKLTDKKLKTYEDFKEAIVDVMKLPVVDEEELKRAVALYLKLKSEENAAKSSH